MNPSPEKTKQSSAAIHRFIAKPAVYNAIQALMGSHKGYLEIVNRLELTPGGRILDVGCGPGKLVDYLGEVEYWGFDTDPQAVAYATERYPGTNTTFVCGTFSEQYLPSVPAFDAILLSGLLHHLDDAEASALLEVCAQALAPSGIILTVDPVRHDGQWLPETWLMNMDRGQAIRSAEGYATLVPASLNISTTSLHQRLWIPYSHHYMHLHRR